jgi:cholesterol transport system auxiliary component
MTISNALFLTRWVKALSILLATCGLCACSLLSKTSSPPPSFYALDGQSGASVQDRPSAVPISPLTLIVSPPNASSGFDSQRIVYVRAAHQLEYFAHSEWVDPPARMLGPLLVAAVQQNGGFASVVMATGTASGELRLNTEILRLQHNFETRPSRVQITLRAYLTDEKTRRVLAWKEFNAEAISAAETPQAGVAAANVVVHEVLTQLAQFLADRQQ